MLFRSTICVQLLHLHKWSVLETTETANLDKVAVVVALARDMLAATGHSDQSLEEAQDLPALYMKPDLKGRLVVSMS